LPKPYLEALRRAHWLLVDAQRELETFILSTPTSDVRNKATDININLLAQIDAAKKLYTSKELDDLCKAETP
jgi:hypothetical protein